MQIRHTNRQKGVVNRISVPWYQLNLSENKLTGLSPCSSVRISPAPTPTELAATIKGFLAICWQRSWAISWKAKRHHFIRIYPGWKNKHCHFLCSLTRLLKNQVSWWHSQWVLMADQFPFPSHQHSFFNQLQLNLRIYVVFTTLKTKNIQIKFILIYSSQKLVSLEQLSSNMAQLHIPLFLPWLYKQ